MPVLKTVRDDHVDSFSAGGERSGARHWRRLPALLMPLLLALSLLVLVIAPTGTAARLVPLLGTAALTVEFVYLAHLVLRMVLLISARRYNDPHNRVYLRSRRCLLSAVNALFGLALFTVMFYPLSRAVIEAAPLAGAGRLFWLLTVGGAIVTLSFGQMVALVLDAVAAESAPASGAP